jgi:hypothetical protein
VLRPRPKCSRSRRWLRKLNWRRARNKILAKFARSNERVNAIVGRHEIQIAVIPVRFRSINNKLFVALELRDKVLTRQMVWVFVPLITGESSQKMASTRTSTDRKFANISLSEESICINMCATTSISHIQEPTYWSNRWGQWGDLLTVTGEWVITTHVF